MAIAATITTAVLADSVDRTSYTTATASPLGGSLLLACIGLTRTTSDVEALSTCTGWSLTWTKIGDNPFTTGSATNRRHWIYAAVTNGPPGSGSLNVTTASTHMSAAIQVVQVTGARMLGDYTGSIRDQGSSVYTTTNTQAGGTSISGTALQAGTNTASRAFSYTVNNGSVLTPRANWTELDEQDAGTPSCYGQVQWRPDAFETATSSTWTGTFIAGIISLEIRAAASGGLGILGVG